jgi:hypothetical protein
MIDHFLKISLEKNKLITIIYQKGSEITRRDIKVMGLDGNHVRAFCYLRNQNRIFIRENILSAAWCSGNTLESKTVQDKRAIIRL